MLIIVILQISISASARSARGGALNFPSIQASACSLGPCWTYPGVRVFTWTVLDEWVNYFSRDQPRAHELTYHTGQPSPAPSVWSTSELGKCARISWGTVPNSPTGTAASFPKIDGTTYTTGFFGSSSYRTRDPTDSNQAMWLCQRRNKSNNSNNPNNSKAKQVKQ